MPGAFNFLETPKGWTNYTVVLTYGENDPDWRENSISVAEIIKNVVKKVILFEMKGQGHILSPDYDINEVYKLYFEK